MKKLLFKLLNLLGIEVTQVEPYTEDQVEDYISQQVKSISRNFVADVFWLKYFSEFPQLGQEILQSNKSVTELIKERDRKVRVVFKKEMAELETGMKDNIKLLLK